MKTTSDVLFFVAVAFATTGCQSIPWVSNLFADGDPDLVLVPAAGFCKDGPTVVVALRNQGSTTARDSTTRVVFSPGGEFRLATPGVESGRISILPPIGVPPECFSPTCDVQVTVDVDDDVKESEEGNNSARETCGASLAP
jgi:subtilase family serine protease